MALEPPDWLFQNIAEASKHSNRIHALYVGFVFFCALTLFGTSDRQIILDEQTHLPLFGSSISFSGFCFAILVIGIVIFVNLQTYLQRLRSLTWKLKTNHPLVTPDRIYPWFVNIADEDKSGFVGLLQAFTVDVSLWFLLPLLFALIPFKFLRTHRPVASYVFTMMPMAGIWLVIIYRSRYERLSIRGLLRSKKAFAGFTILVAAWSICLTFFCIPWAMRGETLFFKRGTLNMGSNRIYWDLRTLTGSWWCVDLGDRI